MVFRRGIVSYHQLPAVITRERLVSALAFTLLEQMPTVLSPRDEYAIEIIYDQIQGGPYAKRTFVNRYRKLDPVLGEMIDNLRSTGDPVRIHDMAASNAVTSVELFETLNRDRNVAVFASDYFDCFHIVTMPDSGWQVVFDAILDPVQYVGYGMVLSGKKPERKRFPVNRAIRHYLKKKMLVRAKALLAAGLAGRNNYSRRLDQFHPAALALAKRDARFTVGRDDLFDPAPASFDVVRIMSAYAGFPDNVKRDSLKKISATIVEGGLLVIGRNRGRDRHEIPTSFFEKRGVNLHSIREIDGGSELKHLIGT